MDTVVYETKNRAVYVIQFETENHEWTDSGEPQYRSRDAAVKHLNLLPNSPYPYRIVERSK